MNPPGKLRKVKEWFRVNSKEELRILWGITAPFLKKPPWEKI